MDECSLGLPFVNDSIQERGDTSWLAFAFFPCCCLLVMSDRPRKRAHIAERPKLSAEHVSAGRGMHEIVSTELPHLISEMKGNLSDQTLTFATMCSGSELVCHALGVLAEQFDTNGVSFSFKQAFACESCKAKQYWGMAVVGETDVCCFTDIQHLHKPEAWCARHDAFCPVPRCSAVMVGLSCKDLSPAGRRLGNCLVPKNVADIFYSTNLFWVRIVFGVACDSVVFPRKSCVQQIPLCSLRTQSGNLASLFRSSGPEHGQHVKQCRKAHSKVLSCYSCHIIACEITRSSRKKGSYHTWTDKHRTS